MTLVERARELASQNTGIRESLNREAARQFDYQRRYLRALTEQVLKRLMELHGVAVTDLQNSKCQLKLRTVETDSTFLANNDRVAELRLSRLTGYTDASLLTVVACISAQPFAGKPEAFPSVNLYTPLPREKGFGQYRGDFPLGDSFSEMIDSIEKVDSVMEKLAEHLSPLFREV